MHRGEERDRLEGGERGGNRDKEIRGWREGRKQRQRDERVERGEERQTER